MKKWNAKMCSYQISREDYIKAFCEGVPSDLLRIGLIFLSDTIKTANFVAVRDYDEYYYIHLSSGTVISHYKNLGRCNVCNKKLTFEDYVEFFTMLSKEYEEEDLTDD